MNVDADVLVTAKVALADPASTLGSWVANATTFPVREFGGIMGSRRGKPHAGGGTPLAPLLCHRRGGCKDYGNVVAYLGMPRLRVYIGTEQVNNYEFDYILSAKDVYL
jgi:hypothetical protein